MGAQTAASALVCPPALGCGAALCRQVGLPVQQPHPEPLPAGLPLC